VTHSTSSTADRLTAHLRDGTLLDLAPDRPAGALLDETEMRAWDETHDVAADLLRELLRGRVVTDPDPRGLRLRGARICGRLDLDRLSTTIGFALEDCLLDHGVTADAAHLPDLMLRRCRMSHPTKIVLSGEELRVDNSISLAGSVVGADTTDSAIYLLGARIGGQLLCSGATLRNPSGPALAADRLQIDGNVFLDEGFTADCAGELGAIRLLGARIGGQLVCRGAILSNSTGPALYADRLETGSDVALDEGFTAHGAGELGAICLLGAHIGGQLMCSATTLSNPTGPALAADTLQTDGAVFLHEGFTADGAGELGAVRLLGANIAGPLICGGATLRNLTGPALAADGLHTDGSVSFNGSFTAEGAGELGAIGLLGAHIGGQFSCRGAILRNPSGPALAADRLHTDGNVSLDEGFTAYGAGELGAIRLLGVYVGGQLSCRGAILRNLTGPALYADGLQADSDVFLDEGFTAHGAGARGVICLFNARIAGPLACRGAILRNPTGPALAADRLQTDGAVSLNGGFTAEGVGKQAAVLLLGARIGGQLDCRRSFVINRSNSRRRWNIDGLTYAGVPQLDPGGDHREAWLKLLRNATPCYTAQPYQQLAAAYRAEGHDSDVRVILIAQRRDQIDLGALTRRADRWWARLTGMLIGYGYQPWRALLYLLIVFTVSVVLALVLGGSGGALARIPDPQPTPSLAGSQVSAAALVPCTVVQMIGKGLDIGTPFLSTSRAVSGNCETTTSTTGAALTISRWILQLTAWALAALFIAGFTGIVRKT